MQRNAALTPQDKERAKAYGGAPAWLAGRVTVAGRRWRNVLFGRRDMDSYLFWNCGHLNETYAPLIAALLAPWNSTGIDLRLITGQHDVLYIFKDRVYLQHGSERARLMPTYHSLVQHIRLAVKLPDMALPINPADEMRAPLPKDGSLPSPLMSFCKTEGYSDILIPNTIEGDVFLRPPQHSSLSPTIRAGPGDPRKPMAVWRGSMDAAGAFEKGRSALLAMGVARPDVLDSGVKDWDEARWGPHQGRLKPVMTVREQVDTYKYVIWVPGNCASVRLALQLASDCLVLKVETPEVEWYYGMLKPYHHYVPLHANSTHVDVVEAVEWAESHALEVRRIVENANAFAKRFLSDKGRDCYFVQLLKEFHGLLRGDLRLPSDAEYTPEWACC
eukprot:jgi/Botrbrau1/3721/Bobra.0363s0008.2